MAGDLEFSEITGDWRCGSDWPKGTVFVTKVTGPDGFVALVYMCNVNIDYDGSSRAYGPPGTDFLDDLKHAGPSATKGWYGVSSLSEKDATDLQEKVKKHIFPVLEKDVIRPVVDPTAPMDKFKRFPVIQQRGEPHPGLYVSATSSPRNTSYPEWDQRHWWDASAVPFGALSGKLRDLGNVSLNDVGLAIRLGDKYQSCGFFFKDTGPDGWAVGECSHKVFTELGGKGKNNNFSVCYILFPGSADGKDTKIHMIKPKIIEQLGKLIKAHNHENILDLMAFYGDGDKDKSGYGLWKDYEAKTDEEKLKIQQRLTHRFHILTKLQTWGYSTIGDFPFKRTDTRIA